MSKLEDLQDVTGHGEPDARLRLQFRVITLGGQRKAFRLEAVFWEALERLAEAHERSLAEEIEARLSGAAGELNQSAALRAGVAGDLLDLWSEAERLRAKPAWSNLVAGLPSPAFLISQRSVLLSANEPLLSYIERRRAGAGAPVNSVAGALSISVEAPASAIAELMADTTRRFVVCNVIFKSGLQRIACRVRLVRFQAAGAVAPPIIGFLDLSDA